MTSELTPVQHDHANHSVADRDTFAPPIQKTNPTRGSAVQDLTPGQIPPEHQASHAGATSTTRENQ
jgi:hypothetical protein